MDVKKVAKLANLPLNDDLAQKLEKNLEETVNLVDKLTTLNLDGIEPSSQVTGLTNIMREDEIEEKRMIKIGDYFRVKAIFNDVS